MKPSESKDSCQKYLQSINKEFFINGLGCNGTFDSLLCWEATPGNSTIIQKCPEVTGVFDTSKVVYKYCTENGFWENDDNESADGGKTDYLKYCLSDSAKEFSGYLNDGRISSTVLRISRYVEFTGLLLSLICICFSLFIFLYFKVLKCNRTKIHIHLFFAILIQSILRLIIYVDQLAAEKSEGNEVHVVSEIAKHTQGLCQSLYILLHYSLSSMFMWMLIEGVYLNILLTISIFDENKHKMMIWFYCFGWGFPVLLVMSWAIVMICKIGINNLCWIGYDKMKYYWILQGPRFVIMTVNVLCLFNVIRILVTKLRENHTTETQQIRKSLRAAILLLPLLGIAHVVNFFDPPQQSVLYTIYTIATNVLLMYQGFFVSVLYCFLNNEVKVVLKRCWLNKRGLRRHTIKSHDYPSVEPVDKIEKQKFIVQQNEKPV